MTMTSFSTRVTMDAGLLVATLGLVGGWFGGRAVLFGIAAGFVNLFRTVNRAGRNVDDGK